MKDNIKDTYYTVDEEKFYHYFNLYKENEKKAYELYRWYSDQYDYENYKYESDVYLHIYRYFYKDKMLLAKEYSRIKQDYVYIINATYFNIDTTDTLEEKELKEKRL